MALISLGQWTCPVSKPAAHNQPVAELTEGGGQLSQGAAGEGRKTASPKCLITNEHKRKCVNESKVSSVSLKTVAILVANLFRH